MPTATDFSTEAIKSNFPPELQRRHQFVAWEFRLNDADKKPRKVPKNPRNGEEAAVNDSETWGSFDDAIAAVQKYGLDGIGFMFSSGDPYCGFDFDNILSYRDFGLGTERSINPDASESLNMLAPYGYAETSVSRTGVHVILRGKLPRHSAKKSYGTGEHAWSVEAYDQSHFFVITGERW